MEIVGEELLGRLAGPAIIALAAVIAAAIAAFVAMRNHKRELNHDRDERRRENTRLVLDGAIEVVISTLGTFADFEALLVAAEGERTGLDALMADDDADAEEKSAARSALQEVESRLDQAFQGVSAVTRELAASNARIGLRLGVLSPIPTAYEELGDAYRAYAEALMKGIPRSLTADEQNDLAARLKGTDAPFAHLMQLCEGWHSS